MMGLKDQRNSRQISDLFDCIESMKTEPYSLQTYMTAPEKRVRHELQEKLRVRDMKSKSYSRSSRHWVSGLIYFHLFISINLFMYFF